MTITVGDAATAGEKELKTKYPVTKGLVAGTTKQTGNQSYLKATKSSNVLTRNLVGIR